MKPFDVIVADPPWQFGDKLGKRGAAANYQTMGVESLSCMPLPPIADNAWLFLWRVASMQQEALNVACDWGFTVKTEIVWQKLTVSGEQHFGMGHYVRASHETCLVCTRGSVRSSVRNIRSTFAAKCPSENGRAIHSAKPDEFFELVERLTGPGLNRVEMFSRRDRDGWAALGHETGKRGRAA